MTLIHPVILSGGSGTRLWPLSRASYPKQLLSLLTPDKTMLQDTIARAAGAKSATLQVADPLFVCNQDHRFLVREQCFASGHTPEAIYLEPVGRNTAPAIALAALHLAEGASKPDALMLVLPADHIVTKKDAFTNAVQSAAKAAEQGFLVTFGITPTSPETGFGYIRGGQPIKGCPDVAEIVEFVEKPNRATAEQYLADGTYTWNSGMFMFTARRYLEELGKYRRDILESATKAWHKRVQDLSFTRPDEQEFKVCPSDSIDYAVMQPTKRAAVVPAELGWSDVGSWDSLWQNTEQDVNGNVTVGDALVSGTTNSYVRAQSRLVAVVGLDNVVVVETADAVLVMDRNKSQQIKDLVETFKSTGRTEHLEHLRVYRPWGWYEGIDSGDRFQVKRIMVKPGERLSLQMHHHRAEHWIVVSGTAKVTVNNNELVLTENQSTYIPLGHTHRLENPGKIPLHLIEVQSGAYLGEDDIVRYEDVYGRST